MRSVGRTLCEKVGGVVNAKIDINKCYHSNKNGRFIYKYSYEAQEYMMQILDMSVAEFKRVEKEINTNYYSRYKNEPIIEHFMPDYIYYADNKGFYKYKFFDKIPNVQIKEKEQWNT